MNSILLGHDCATHKPVRIDKATFGTHYHFIGGTGKGKTTALHTILQPLLCDPSERACFIIIDRLGNFSDELLTWMASEEFCTDYVRDRLVYIRPSREDLVLPFNPLLYDTRAHGYFKVERTTEIVLRAWESVNIEAMPRLARWTFNAFWAAAQMGLTVSDCAHFLFPGSDYHRPLLQLLPRALQAEWNEITRVSGNRSTELLDSSRNRLKPYFESDILRRMFGSTENRLDVARFMREGKIVLLDLAPRERLASQLANTIGAMALNEVIATARNLPRTERYSTYVFLDEFQNFVGPDLVDALPEVRQLGLKFLLSHQSLSQLERGDYDLTQMIFQAQNRLVFGVQGEDAETLAHEFASITFDPKRIKDEIYSRRQMVKGQKIIELSSWSESEQQSDSWQKSYGDNWSTNENTVQAPGALAPTKGRGSGKARQEGGAEGGGHSTTRATGKSQALTPDYEEFQELSSRTYESFDEQKSIWARDIRNLRTGEAVLRLVNQPRVYRVHVKRSAPGYLRYDANVLEREFPGLIERKQALIERSLQNDLFVAAETIDREIENRLARVAERARELDQDEGDQKGDRDGSFA